jgi:hypothetical protein
LLVCNWPHSVGQNHFFVKILFIRDSAIQKCSRRFCTVCKSENSVPCQPSDNMSYRLDAQMSNASTVQMHIILKHHPSGRHGFLSEPSSVSRSFELLQLPYVRTIQQPIRTTLNVRSSFRISFQTQIWEDCCNRPDHVDSHPDALIHKASIAIQIRTSGRQSAWFGRTCIRYGNCMHQIDRLDAHPPGSDARSLFMEITCSGRATVRTTVPHRPDAALKQERFSAKFWSYSCPSGRPMTTV